MALPDDFDLKSALVTGLREVLPNFDDSTFRVLPGYPNNPELLPCVSVMDMGGSLGPETIGEVWNSNNEPYFTDPDTLELFEVRGTYYKQSAEVAVWATDADDRDTIKRWVRRALWRLRRQFSSTEDFQQSTITDKGDQQDFEDQAPQDIYSYAFEVSGIAPLLDYIPAPPPATDVTITVGYIEEENLDDEV